MPVRPGLSDPWGTLRVVYSDSIEVRASQLTGDHLGKIIRIDGDQPTGPTVVQGPVEVIEHRQRGPVRLTIRVSSQQTVTAEFESDEDVTIERGPGSDGDR